MDRATMTRVNRPASAYLAASPSGAPWKPTTPMANRAAAGGAQAAQDQWLADRGEVAPPWCSGRLAKLVQTTVNHDHDPEHAVKAARFVGRYADLFESEWAIVWRGDADPKHIAAVALGAVELLAQGLPLELVVRAVVLCARAHMGSVTPFYGAACVERRDARLAAVRFPDRAERTLEEDAEIKAAIQDYQRAHARKAYARKAALLEAA